VLDFFVFMELDQNRPDGMGGISEFSSTLNNHLSMPHAFE
jgi:hypothetical protein